MADKYIIEKHEKDSIWRMYADAYGDVTVEGVDLTPYTEPDMEKIRNESFKNGYDAACKDIDIKSKTNAAYRKGYQDTTVKISSDEQAIAEKAYQSGLNDAWEAARKICLNESDGGLSGITVHDIFNTEHYRDALRDYTPAKAIEKIRQYEQEQEDDHDRKKVVALADDIGIHKLYALVREIRGE